jgi:hypothetical protein
MIPALTIESRTSANRYIKVCSTMSLGIYYGGFYWARDQEIVTLSKKFNHY